jgi:hypothetical protein
LAFALSIGVEALPGSGFSIPDLILPQCIDCVVEHVSLIWPPASLVLCDVAALALPHLDCVGGIGISLMCSAVSSCSSVIV